MTLLFNKASLSLRKSNKCCWTLKVYSRRFQFWCLTLFPMRISFYFISFSFFDKKTFWNVIIFLTPFLCNQKISQTESIWRKQFVWGARVAKLVSVCNLYNCCVDKFLMTTKYSVISNNKQGHNNNNNNINKKIISFRSLRLTLNMI